MTNPLLTDWTGPYKLPPFTEISDADFAPAFDAALTEARANIAAIADSADAPTFANTIEAIDANRIRRLDLSFSPERTTPGSGPDEELSPADQTVRRLLELEGDGFGAIEACTAVEEYLSTLVD